MGYIAEALWRIKLKDYSSAARLLTDHVNDTGLKSSSKVSIMEWIADCHSKAENPTEAARWFELAGRMALECNDFSKAQRRRKAAQEFQQAIDCCMIENDMNGIRRLAVLKHALNAPVN